MTLGQFIEADTLLARISSIRDEIKHLQWFIDNSDKNEFFCINKQKMSGSDLEKVFNITPDQVIMLAKDQQHNFKKELIELEEKFNKL